MRVFIMRHGEAGFNAFPDAERNLTEKGKDQAIAQAEWLSTQIAEIEKVIVSPYNRALQTYKVLASSTQTQLPKDIETWHEITPHGNSQVVSDYVNSLLNENINSVLIVSHLPLVAELVGDLCQGTQWVGFNTGTIAEVSISSSSLSSYRGQLIQLQHPMA